MFALNYIAHHLTRPVFASLSLQIAVRGRLRVRALSTAALGMDGKNFQSARSHKVEDSVVVLVLQSEGRY